MKQLKAVIKKEFIQTISGYSRIDHSFSDAFDMILAVTGTQENAFKNLYDNKSDILFVDNDQEYLGKQIQEGLKNRDIFM